jgi:hypothetical protein
VKQGITVLALLALTGCSSISNFTERHPTTTKVIVGSIALSAALALDSRGGGPREEPRMSNPLVDCSKAPGSCQ